MEARLGIGQRIDEDTHRGLPAGIDLALGEVGLEPGEVLDLEVPEQVVTALEDRIVAGAGRLEFGEHLRPDRCVPSPVFRFGTGEQPHLEADPLHRILPAWRSPGTGGPGAATSMASLVNRWRSARTPVLLVDVVLVEGQRRAEDDRAVGADRVRLAAVQARDREGLALLAGDRPLPEG